MEAEITFGSLGSSPPVSSNADSGSFATLAFGGGSEGGGGKVGGSSRDSRGGGDAGGGGDVRGGATRGDDARIAGSQDARCGLAVALYGRCLNESWRLYPQLEYINRYLVQTKAVMIRSLRWFE